MIPKSLFKSSFIYTIVGSLPYAAGFLLLPWLTIYLTPAQFGINAMYISIMYFVQIIASFGMDISVATIYFDYRDKQKQLREVLGTIFISVVVVGVFTSVAFALGGFRLITIVLGSENLMTLIPFGLITIVSALFNAVFKVYSTLLIYQQRPERFLWINLVNFLLTVAGTLGILYAFPFSLSGPILGRLIPAVVSASIAVIFLAREVGISWNGSYLRYIFRLSYPLMLFALLTWVVNYIDRFIILGILGDPAIVGIYDVAIKLVLFLELILSGLINTVNPRIFAIWKKENATGSSPEVNRYYSGLTAIFMLLIPLFVLVAPQIIPWFIRNPVYFSAFPYLAILAAGYVTRVWFYMFLAPLVYFKKTSALPKVLLYSSIFEIAAGVALMRMFGIQGMVWTFFLVKPVQALFMWLESRKIYEYRMNNLKLFVLPSLFMAVVVSTEWMATDATRIWFHLAQLAASIALVWIGYRREIRPLILKWKGR